MKPALFFLALSLILSQLFLRSPFNYIYGIPGDNYEFLAFQNLVKDNLSSGRYPLAHTDTLRYPNGFNLSYGYDGAFAVFTGALLSFIFSPIFAYNLTIFLILFANLYLSYIFFRRLSPSWVQGLIATLIFASSPFVLSRLQAHLNLAFLAGFPLLGIAYLRLKHSSSFKNLFFCQLALFILATGSLQYFILLAYNALIFLPLTYFLFPQLRFKLPSLNHFLLSLLAILPFYLYFFNGYALAILSHQLFIVDKTANYLRFDQPWFFDLFLPNRFLNPLFALINPSPISIEKVIYPGITGIGLLIFFFRSHKITPPIKVLLGISVALFALIALGGLKLPLYPEGGREIVILTFILAIITALYLQIKQKNGAYYLIGLLLLERLLFRPSFSPPFSSVASLAVASNPGTASLNIPTSKYSAFYSSLPGLTHKKTVDGYFHFTADNAQSNQFLSQDLIQRFICQSEKALPENYHISSQDLSDTRTLLKTNDIKTIIVHKNGKYFFDECLQTRNWWYQLNPPTTLLSDPVSTVTSQTIEIVAHPQFSYQFYAQKSGTLTLHGIFLNPNYLNHLTITTPSGQSESVSLVPADNGVKNDKIPLFQGYVNAGDNLRLSSPYYPIKETIYATFWYTFEPTQVSPTIPLPFEPVYSDSEVEVYRLN